LKRQLFLREDHPEQSRTDDASDIQAHFARFKPGTAGGFARDFGGKQNNQALPS